MTNAKLAAREALVIQAELPCFNWIWAKLLPRFEKLWVSFSSLRCMWRWGIIQIQHSLTRFFEAVPHVEGVMFNINWSQFKTLQNPCQMPRFYALCWPELLIPWPHPGLASPGRNSCTSCSHPAVQRWRKIIFWQLLCDTVVSTPCFLLQNQWAPHPCTSPLSFLPW